MKSIHIVKIMILSLAICSFSVKIKAQQLASQRPLSAFYTKKTQAYLAAKKQNNRQLAQLQRQNLPSARPLPRQATEAKIKNPAIARNAALPDNEKIRRLPSKSTLAVNRIAARKPAYRRPVLK